MTRASALVVRLRRAAGALTSPRFSTLVNTELRVGLRGGLGVEWRLSEVDVNERPTGRVALDLLANLGKFDPTGRNGEPRPDPPGTKRRVVKPRAR